MDEGRNADIDRVEMGDKTDGWHLRPGAPFDGSHDGMFVGDDVTQAESAHLVSEQGGKHRLTGRGG